MKNEKTASGPRGESAQRGRWGTQVVSTRGKRWSDKAEATFLDHLATTANVSHSAKACGFSPQALYARRRRNPAFMKQWDGALAQGHAHLNALLLQRAIETFEGRTPDPDTLVRIPEVSFKDALILLGHHRRSVEGGPRSRRQWARPRSLDEMRDSILRKLEAIAPTREEEGEE